MKLSTTPLLESQILEIFGTTDQDQLKQIAADAKRYQNLDKRVNEKKCRVGRKNTFTEPQLAKILSMRKHGETITDIAKKYHVSRQTIYSQLHKAHHFSNDPDVKMRMYFMNRDELCTSIDVDFMHEKIYIKNYTDVIIMRAFGVVENPNWEDFEYFLEERCFPRTRDHAKLILREMGVPFYDPLLIIEKTDGRMAGDNQWILTVKKETTL